MTTISNLQWAEIYIIETHEGILTFPFDYSNRDYIFPSSEVVLNGLVTDIDSVYKGAIISIKEASEEDERIYFETIRNFYNK